jgi:hypothetical protein
MFCESVANQAILYLFDELDANERHVFEQHLAQCPACRAELAVLQSSQRLVRMAPEESIAPVRYTSLVSPLRPVRNRFIGFIQPLQDAIRWLFDIRPRLVVIPAAAVIVALLVIYLFHPFAAHQQKKMQWETNLDAMITSLEDRLTSFSAEAAYDDSDLSNSDWEDISGTLSPESRMETIANNIQTLSNELTGLSF